MGGLGDLFRQVGGLGALMPAKQGLGAVPQGRPTDLRGLMQQMYPALRDAQYGLVNTPNANSDGNMLEAWPADEPGAPDYPRPEGLPMGQFGLQIFDQNTTPRDVAGDVVSHNLVNSDPTLKPLYEKFTQEFMTTPKGQAALREDYARARKRGETRPLEVWAKADRIPAYFRGRVFKQWEGQLSEKDWHEILTPEQLSTLDQMSSYIHGPKK